MDENEALRNEAQAWQIADNQGWSSMTFSKLMSRFIFGSAKRTGKFLRMLQKIADEESAT